MAARSCRACGGSLEGTHPARRYCNDACKKRYQRGARASKDDREAAPPAQTPDGIQSTAAATMLVLAEAGKLATPAGQAALVLAHRIDASHQDTGAGLASMVKRLQETVDGLLADVPEESSPLDHARDELAERRARKGA